MGGEIRFPSIRSAMCIAFPYPLFIVYNLQYFNLFTYYNFFFKLVGHVMSPTAMHSAATPYATILNSRKCRKGYLRITFFWSLYIFFPHFSDVWSKHTQTIIIWIETIMKSDPSNAINIIHSSELVHLYYFIRIRSFDEHKHVVSAVIEYRRQSKYTVSSHNINEPNRQWYRSQSSLTI